MRLSTPPHPGIPSHLNASLTMETAEAAGGVGGGKGKGRKTEESGRTMELFFSGIVKCFGDLDLFSLRS